MHNPQLFTGSLQQGAALMHEVGIVHDAIRVDLRTKKLEVGSDDPKVNPKGAVPALGLESGV